MDTTTRNIGELKGTLLIFGGVYSNLQALVRLKEFAADWGILPNNIICTGDVVGYCAEPEACVQLIEQWGVHCIAGNVEIQLATGEEDCGCNFDEGSRCDRFSRKWYPYSQSQLSSDSINWIRTLPRFLRFQYANKRVLVLHGSYFNTSEFIFESTPWVIKQTNLTAAAADVILGGHSGLPFSQSNNGSYWLNAGVIGMPANDGTTRVWCMIMHETTTGFAIQHHSFDYDYERAARLMEDNQLPSEYSSTLRTGIWDNCEILPEKETAAQGKMLIF